jgi:hypothetical protein
LSDAHIRESNLNRQSPASGSLYANFTNSKVAIGGVFSNMDAHYLLTLPSLATPFLLSLFPLLLLGTIILYLLANRFKPVVRKLPGPILAKYTGLWRMWTMYQGDFMNVAMQLHKKYGTFVRIAPNYISVSDPSAMPIIYGLANGFLKVFLFVYFELSTNL